MFEYGQKLKRGLNIAAVVAMGIASVSCESTQKQNEPTIGSGTAVHRIASARLESLYDGTLNVNHDAAWAAAVEVSKLPREELAMMDVYYGVRGHSATSAHLIGEALEVRAGTIRDELGSASEVTRLAEAALRWNRRALKEIDPVKDFVMAAVYRLAIARCYLLLEQEAEAVELLANRLDTRPLPAELEVAYDALLKTLAK